MTNQTLSFPQAIASTQALMAKIDANQLSEAEIEAEIISIVQTKQGGRGFFVAYLTNDLTLADNPSPGVINALKSSIEVVKELLVKNLAMSSAMAIAHDRNNDSDQVEGSRTVCQRTGKLIQLMKSQSIEHELQKLQATINTEQGDYEDFLNRWGYDAEQKLAIVAAINNILPKKS